MNDEKFDCQVCFSKKLMVARFPSEEHEGIMILESSPFPSYYSVSGFPNSLKSVKDHHLYLIVKKPFPCFQDRVFRYSFKLKEKMGFTFHVSPGQITFQNETFPMVRVRTDETSQLNPLIDTYRALGIQFMKDRKIQPYEATVQFKRYTKFEKVGDEVYKDRENPNRHFIKIPVDIDIDAFDKIIFDIKNNCDFHMFDASLVYLNCGDNFIDMVSIYSDHCDENRLPELHKSLIEEIKRLKPNASGR